MNIFFWNRARRTHEQKVAVGEFAHQNPDLIVIIADPKDDTVFVAYDDRFVSGRMKTEQGTDARILKDLMRSSRLFDSQIDRFLMGLMDVLKVRRMTYGVNNLLQFIDGALYNISQRHREKFTGQPHEGSVESPLNAADVVGPTE